MVTIPLKEMGGEGGLARPITWCHFTPQAPSGLLSFTVINKGEPHRHSQMDWEEII